MCFLKYSIRALCKQAYQFATMAWLISFTMIYKPIKKHLKQASDHIEVNQHEQLTSQTGLEFWSKWHMTGLKAVSVVKTNFGGNIK